MFVDFINLWLYNFYLATFSLHFAGLQLALNSLLSILCSSCHSCVMNVHTTLLSRKLHISSCEPLFLEVMNDFRS